MSKGLKAFDSIKWEVLEWTEGYEEDLDIIEKELRALEIIKEKEVDISLLIAVVSAFDYNKHFTHYRSKCLNLNEYDLLKEIFDE